MKAQEVLRCYAAGDRDFCNANLRGANFKGQDLSGANFSGADIRSANFTNANLQGVNLTKARAGLQRRWMVVQPLLITVTAIVAGVLQGFAGGHSIYFFDSSNFNSATENVTAEIVYLLLVFAAYAAISFQGFTIRAFGSILTAFGFGFAFACVGAVAFGFGFAFVSAFTGVGALAFAFAFAGTVAFAFAGTGAVGTVGAGAVVTGTVIVASAGVVVGAGAFAFVNVGVGLLFSLYIGWRVFKEDERFALLRGLGIALAALGGTSFAGADLTGATFSQALLNNTNFADSHQNQTNLNHVCWKKASKLNRARLGSAILQDRRVRTLLTEPEKGYKQDFTDANLRGANLSGVTLEQAILRRAILNDALLRDAVFEGAILTEAQAVNADFTGARLTGATLEAWNIDSTTTLKNIDCRYIFLRETPDERGLRERRPHNPDKVFQPGDFEKFFKEMLDEVQILIRNGVDPLAFRAALQNIMKQNPDITPKAYERHGTDIMVTLQVPDGTDKADVERAWDEGYQTGLKAGRNVERLESADIWKEMALLGAGKNITFENRNEVMTGNDQSQTFGGDVNINANQSVVNLRDISGQVNVQISQLSDEPTQTQLKDLLAQLQTAIEDEESLSEEEKTEALAEVKEIAKAGQAPEDGPMKKAARRSLNVLKGMTVGVGSATKFVEACNGLLPAIALLFGL